MVSIREYLVNAAIIISIIYLSSFLHKHLFMNIKKSYKDFSFVIIAILAGWCSMVFGIHLNKSVIFDLRFVPIIIATLHFKNPTYILFIGIGIGLVRFTFGINPAATVGFINMLILAISGAFSTFIFNKTGYYKKMLYIIIILNILNTGITMVLGVISFNEYLKLILPIVFPTNILLSLLLFWVVKDLKDEFFHKKDLWNKANKDPLTKVYNRRAFMQFFHQYAFDHPEAYPLAVAFIDIDHFKNINDQYGHLVGDSVLKKVSSLISDNLRSFDIISRYGGEEFVVILPNCSKEDAVATIERIRKTIDNSPFEANDREIHVTFSAGIATTETIQPKNLLKAADEAVYAAKRKGRNMVLCAEN